MATRLDTRYIIPDAKAKTKKQSLQKLELEGTIEDLVLIRSYNIDCELLDTELTQVAGLLCNPLIEDFSAGKSCKDFDWVLEIGFLPGVTDNVGSTAQQTIEDCLQKKFTPDKKVYSSQVILLAGDLTENDAKVIAASQYNPLIQKVTIKKFKQFKEDKGMGIYLPKVNLKPKAMFTRVDLNVSDKELALIGQEGIRGPLALGLDYMKAIQKYFRNRKRNPTDIELESIAQTWSEHCKHTIFNDPIDEINIGLYKEYIQQATNLIRKKKGGKDFCVSVFKDNSGAIEFDDTYLITHKVETHNSPSALDPFGGALTGIVGVNRDAIGCGMGAKPIANTFGFCFGEPEDTRPLYRDKQLKQKMLNPKRIMEGVIEGVNVGGNCSGIPTVQGFVYFNEKFRGKPLVFVGTLGLMPKYLSNGCASHLKQALPGDYIVMVGGRVGQDGIHGATFSSVEMNSGSPASAVQIGDPITQKKFSDAIVKEARDKNLYNSITDNGAGGLSCSVAEMARESGGCYVELDKVPLKYPGLEAWQIWISESQERMTLAVPVSKWQEFSDLMTRRAVEATIIGKFTDSGRCVVSYEGQVVMDLELEFLHNGLPERHLQTFSPVIASIVKQSRHSQEDDNERQNQKLLKMVKSLNIASYEFISQQYDHEVQGGSVIKPLQGRGRVNGDVAVVKPVLGSQKAVLLTAALGCDYSDINADADFADNAYHVAASAVDNAIRAAVAAGANLEKIALLDNFCWCSANEPERLAQLKNAAKACFDFAVAYETPFISGKDSMFNDFKGFDENGDEIKISIPPTLLISAVAVIDDAVKVVSIDPKFCGDLVYLLGDVHCSPLTLAGAEQNKKLYEKLSKCIDTELISSAISTSRGGLAVALAKMAMAGKLGVEVNVSNHELAGALMRDDDFLFNDDLKGILVTVAESNKEQFESLINKEEDGRDLSMLIGKITDSNRLSVMGHKGNKIIDLEIDIMLDAYRNSEKLLRYN